MRNLPKVTQLVSGRTTIHTQVCLMPQPILSTLRGQNMAQFCSQGSVMARFALSPRYSASLRRGAAGLVIPQHVFGLRCARVSHSGNLPSCKLRTKSRRRGLVCGRPTCPFPRLMMPGSSPSFSPVSQSLPGLREDSRKVITCLTLGRNS